MIKHLLYFVLFFAIASCSQETVNDSMLSVAPGKQELLQRSSKELNQSDFIQWVKGRQSGLYYKSDLKNIQYELFYNPVDYLILRDNDDKQINSQFILDERKEYDGLIYFNFKITVKDGQREFLKEGISNMTEYDQRVNYCAFGMQKDVSIIYGSDTITSSLFHFERAYDLAPYGYFLLGFSNKVLKEKEITFLFDDHLFQQGPIKICIPTDVLTHLPKLKLS